MNACLNVFCESLNSIHPVGSSQVRHGDSWYADRTPRSNKEYLGRKTTRNAVLLPFVVCYFSFYYWNIVDTQYYVSSGVWHCCFCSVAQACLTLFDPMDCSTSGFPVLHYISWSLLKLMSIELVMPSSVSLLLMPSIFLSIRIFSNESALCIRWTNTGASALASVLPMNI